jgi:hypothetical protein
MELNPAIQRNRWRRKCGLLGHRSAQESHKPRTGSHVGGAKRRFAELQEKLAYPE